MKRRADRGTVRLRLLAASTCVARVAWYAEGRLVGHRRVWHRETDLFLPAGRWTLEVTDERSPADPTRLAATRVEVLVRAGWRTTTEVVLEHGAVLRGTVATAEEQRVRFATVSATAADGRVFTVRADGLGTFTLSGLPSTTHLVRATKRAWQSAPVLVEPQVGEPTEVRLHLVEPVTPVSRSGAAELVVGAAFTGRVVDPTTEAPAYAALVELRASRVPRARVQRGGPGRRRHGRAAARRASGAAGAEQPAARGLRADGAARHPGLRPDPPNVAVASVTRRVRWQGGVPKAGRQALRGATTRPACPDGGAQQARDRWIRAEARAGVAVDPARS